MAFGSQPAPPPRDKYRSGCIGFALLSLVLMAAMVGFYFWQQSGKTTANEGANELLKSQAAAWNKGDLAGFTKTYRMHEDVTFYSEGRVYKGWEQLNERYRIMYGGRPMGELAYDDVTIEVLGIDAAMLRGKWIVKSEAGTRTGLFTMLARKFPEGWKIMHDHMTIGDLR